MTPIFGLCDDYVLQWAALDPVAAGMRGIVGDFGPATDYSPDGFAARAALIHTTLSELTRLPVTSDDDRLAADHLRERLEAEAAWHVTGEPLRLLRAPFGLLSKVRDSVELLPHGDDRQWRGVVARLDAIPGMLASWRASLDAGQQRGHGAARRQALESAVQADRYAEGTHTALVDAYGRGPLAAELEAAAAKAHAAYAEMARYLREDYAPVAPETDPVGADRYAVAARQTLGADVDLEEAYAWGWEELARIEAEMAREAERVRPGAGVDEATALLDETRFVVGPETYREWLQERHDWAWSSCTAGTSTSPSRCGPSR